MSTVRIHFLFLLLMCAAAVISSRLFSLQVREQSFWQAMAKGQQQLYEELEPERGKIFFQDKDGKLFPAAMNQFFPMLYASPKEIEDPKEAAQFLAQLFTEDQEVFLAKLEKKDDPYEPLRRRLSPEQAQQIRDRNIRGLHLKEERLRVYPQKTLAAHVLGFVGYADNGNRIGTYGIEGAFEAELRGKKGFLRGEKDVRGNLISFLSHNSEKPQNGDAVILTIDQNVQRAAEDALKRAFEKWQADGASIIVMDPRDGAIRAMASFPTFDPDTYQEAEDAAVYVNPVTSHLFEPGSVFKPLTMAAAIDAGVLTPYSTYENTNEVQIGGYTIRNVVQEKTGMASMIEVLEYSLNTGAVFAESALGHEKFREYLEKFGLGEKIGIALPGETQSNLSNLREIKDISFATASFGQGIAVTPLALLRALAVIANGGNLIQPHIVAEIRPGEDEKGAPKKFEHPVLQQIISPKTASQVAAMMVGVVRNGTAKRAQIPGYTIAGKTGTAEVPSTDRRGYESSKTIHSFVGFAPAFDPKFIVLVKLDNPKGVRYAEGSAVPAFREVAEYLLSYYGIPPDDVPN